MLPLGYKLEGEMNHHIDIDELRDRLSKACLELLKGNLSSGLQDSLKKALKIPVTPIPNKDGDGKKALAAVLGLSH
jgi:hypothetical protein